MMPRAYFLLRRTDVTSILLVTLGGALLLMAGGLRHASELFRQSNLPIMTSSGSIQAPAKLIVPALAIDVPLESVGVNVKGEMAVPHDAGIPGWYKGSVFPGLPGNAVIAGHKDSIMGMRGIFADLQKMQIGDIFSVKDTAGKLISFRVTDVQSYDAGNAPVHQIFGTSRETSHLQLITCIGDWVPRTGEYAKRLVVFSERVGI
jgi:sortase A